MISLTKSLPNTLKVNGQAFLIDTHFSTWIRLQNLIKEDIEPGEMVAVAIMMIFDTPPAIEPETAAQAMEQMGWFYRCGDDVKEDEPDDDYYTSRAIPYDYDIDAGLIVAAFQQGYGIDLLADNDMHWWRFRALFDALPEDTLLNKIIGYRTTPTKGMDKRTKEHYEKMRRLFAIGEVHRQQEDIMTRAKRAQERIERNKAERGQRDREFIEKKRKAINARTTADRLPAD